MPNKGNKSKGSKSNGVGNTDHQPTRSRGSQDVNKERSDIKHATDKNERGSTSRTSSSGRKEASGGSPS